MAIIGISGKISSGKDTVGIIIQYLTCIHRKHYTFKEWKERVEEFQSKHTSRFQIKKFADTLKDIICLLLGCTREQLEDADFKNKELSEEWWYYNIPNPSFGGLVNYLDNNLSEEDKKICDARYLVKPTSRMLLQLLGTECGRNIIHPNIWVNALMSEYIEQKHRTCLDCKNSFNFNEFKGDEQLCPNCNSYNHAGVMIENTSNWIITDVRFPNELKAVKDREGISIRVNRNKVLVVNVDGEKLTLDIDEWLKQQQFYENQGWIFKEHVSETALDNAEFDYTIENNSTIEDLIHTVSLILKKEKII